MFNAVQKTNKFTHRIIKFVFRISADTFYESTFTQQINNNIPKSHFSISYQGIRIKNSSIKYSLNYYAFIFNCTYECKKKGLKDSTVLLAKMNIPNCTRTYGFSRKRKFRGVKVN